PPRELLEPDPLGTDPLRPATRSGADWEAPGLSGTDALFGALPATSGDDVLGDTGPDLWRTDVGAPERTPADVIGIRPPDRATGPDRADQLAGPRDPALRTDPLHRLPPAHDDRSAPDGG